MEHFEETLRIICDAVRSVREEEFNALKNACLSALDAGGKIIASGLGKNVPICEKFVGTLNSLGIPAAFMHTNSAVHGDLGMVLKNDIVIVLTKSGRTSESVRLVGLLKRRSCKVFLLSFDRGGTLCRETPDRLIVELEHEGDAWNILPNNSSALNLIILQELAMLIAKERRVCLDTLRENHPGGAIGERLGGETE